MIIIVMIFKIITIKVPFYRAFNPVHPSCPVRNNFPSSSPLSPPSPFPSSPPSFPSSLVTPVSLVTPPVVIVVVVIILRGRPLAYDHLEGLAFLQMIIQRGQPLANDYLVVG